MNPNFSKTDQFGMVKTPPINQELLELSKKWRSLVGDED